jgi:acyl-CoA reductase-like NAD-dependent aldehyde dehydrogenase
MSATEVRILQNFVGGRWTVPAGERYVEDRNPAHPGDVLAHVPLSTSGDAEEAIVAATEAFPAWRRTSAVRRGEVLVEASRLRENRGEELARLLTREQGKPLVESRSEVSRAAHFWAWMGFHAGSIQGITAPTEKDEMMALTLREPLGVVGLITPWNFPVNIPGWKLAGALVCGNTVVFKPAQLAPMCATFLVELLAEAGIPDGVVNLVFGSGGSVGDRLVTDERVRAISFTGSTEVGLSINAKAAPLGKKVQTEMGGHNAVVVLGDADLDRAAEGAAAAAFGTAGQRCTAARRVIAVREVADGLIQRLREATRSLRLGPGDKEGTDISPMVDEKSLDEVLGEIERAKHEGAVVLEGGERAGDGLEDGYFLRPTLLGRVNPGMTVAREEVFGPVLPVLEVTDFERALEVATSTRYGLSSSIYTRDLQKAMCFMHEIDTGVVHVNKPPTGGESHLPFGGLKKSAIGPKEMGAAAEFYTQTKTIYLDYS